MKIDFTSWRICFLACVNRKDIQRHKINEVEILFLMYFSNNDFSFCLPKVYKWSLKILK